MMIEKKQLNEPKAIIIAAIITSAVALIIAYIQVVLPLPTKQQCDRIKLRAEKYSDILNDKIAKSKNDRELISLTFWRDKFKNISDYECKEIDIQFESIMKSFEKAAKQLDL